MPRVSAGLLMFRRKGDAPQVLLAHPGGPLWAKKDLGAWTIPKGEGAPDEDLLATARREFEEETGFRPQGPFHPLGRVKQKSGKVVYAWAFEGDVEPAALRSNTFSMEWPPRSGQRPDFPEVDRAEFFDIAEARRRINPAQAELLDALERLLAGKSG
jgi:predicted NUDIX family NTP pyrophosphohydrolase